MNCAAFLDELRRHLGLPSDYALAKSLQLTRSQVSRYRVGRDVFSDEIALRVAHLLKVKPEYVIACAHSERATYDAELRAAWRKVAIQVAGRYRQHELRANGQRELFA